MDYIPIQDIHNYSIEANLLGLSYHFNRDINWNENNYGIGINIVFSDNFIQLVNYNGIYEDSYNKLATYSLIGFRYFLGNHDKLHGSIGYGLGYFKGSGFHEIGAMPEILIGYNKINLGITGSLQDGMIGCFININVMKF